MSGQAHCAPILAAYPSILISPDQMILLGELSRLLLELAGGVQVRPVGLAEWRETALAACAGRSRSYRDRVGQALAEAVALAGVGASTAALTPELVAALAARPGAAATTNGLLRALRTACGLAADRGWLVRGSLERAAWRVYQGPQTRARHHPREAVARVLGSLEEGKASWDGGRLHALACCYAYTGLRLREALRPRGRRPRPRPGVCVRQAGEGSQDGEVGRAGALSAGAGRGPRGVGRPGGRGAGCFPILGKPGRGVGGPSGSARRIAWSPPAGPLGWRGSPRYHSGIRWPRTTRVIGD